MFSKIAENAFMWLWNTMALGGLKHIVKLITIITIDQSLCGTSTYLTKKKKKKKTNDDSCDKLINKFSIAIGILV